MRQAIWAFIGAALALLLALLLALAVFLAVRRDAAPPAAEAVRTRIIRGFGFVRGRSKTVLRNKFAGFVTKVHIYSQTMVTQGDVIIEYDDLDWRTAVAKLENAVEEQKKALEIKIIELELKKLDPLPSEYRKTQWKLSAAKKRLERHNHELEVYRRLYRSQSISELSLREKAQEVKDAEADLL
ncbi:MAG: hypothetical protein IJJ28_03845, partial [Lentisphaeria bacterium]|nr:hypothetical protein [Lentisphaeria bacterium]